ncbi:hypothetical protein JCM8097_000615 [Rhodosporidiobolus ruineniae]
MSHPPPSRGPHPLASLSASAYPAANFPSSTPLPSTSRGSGLSHSPGSLSPQAHSAEAAAGAEGGRSKKRKTADERGKGLGGAAGDADAKKRVVLSCTECKRRKIKCDRKIPCLACCKRGDAASCRWSDDAPAKEAEVQPFALTTDVVKLARRLQALEEWANQLPPELRVLAPPAQDFSPEIYQSKVKASTKEKLAKEKHPEPRRSTTVDDLPRSFHHDSEADDTDAALPSAAPSRDLSDTEDAAVKLESVAFNAKAPNAVYHPQDSLPFFDTISPGGRGQVSNQISFDPAAELTPMLTSIVARPIHWEGPWSSSSLGFEMCMTLEELKASRSRIMDAVWPYMPNKALSHKLVEKYWVEVDWLHNILHRKSFEAEHERAWEMIEAGRRDEIDPLWLAIWAMVCSLAIDGLRCQTARVELTTEERNVCHPLLWYACAQRFMRLGDAMARAQVRSIQVVLLVGQWLQCSACSGQAIYFLTHLAAAIRHAQILGLHQLTDDQAHMPPPDPAWPPNPCSIRRETALKLFGLLSFFDYISATTRFRGYMLDPLQCSTPPVSNVDADQLSPLEWKLTPHPENVRTDSSFDRAKYFVCRAARDVFQKVVQRDATFSYDTVLELDREYRRILVEFESAIISPGRSADSSVQQWQDLIVLESAYFRSLRLHRPFMARDEYSRKRCLESAEKVIRADLVVLASTNNNAWFAFSHVLAAAICLFHDLFRLIDEDKAEQDIERRKEILVIAFEVFGKSDDILVPQLRYVVQTGSKILSGLFMAEEKRRVTRAAAALVGGVRAVEPASESFAAVLQRLTKEVATQSAPLKAAPAAIPSPVPYPSEQPAFYPGPADGPPPSASSSYTSAAPHPSGLPHPATVVSSMFAAGEQPSFSLPPFHAAPESYSAIDFLREAGLPSSFQLDPNDFSLAGQMGVPPPNGMPDVSEMQHPHPHLHQQHQQQQQQQVPPLAAMSAAAAVPLPNGAFPSGFYGQPAAAGMDWSFASDATGTGEDPSKLAGNALLDQLAGGVW